MPEMKNICGKIPIDLHEKVRQEIEETESSAQKFIQQVIEEHFMKKGESSMEARTIAVQVTEELFFRMKEVVRRKGCKQKAFLIGVIEQAIAAEEAKWKEAEGEADTEEFEETDANVSDEEEPENPEDAQWEEHGESFESEEDEVSDRLEEEHIGEAEIEEGEENIDEVEEDTDEAEDLEEQE